MAALPSVGQDDTISLFVFYLVLDDGSIVLDCIAIVCIETVFAVVKKLAIDISPVRGQTQIDLFFLSRCSGDGEQGRSRYEPFALIDTDGSCCRGFNDGLDASQQNVHTRNIGVVLDFKVFRPCDRYWVPAPIGSRRNHLICNSRSWISRTYGFLEATSRGYTTLLAEVS